MINLTAVIRCKPGSAEAVRDALAAVGTFAQANEPGTLGYVVVRSNDDSNLFVTQERFRDKAAMDTHNNGEGSKAFFEKTEGLLEKVEIHIGDEVCAISR